MDWQPIDKAPFDRDLEVGVIAAGKAHALVFPCRRVGAGWSNALTNEVIALRPTHWRYWSNVKHPPNGKIAASGDVGSRRIGSKA